MHRILNGGRLCYLKSRSPPVVIGRNPLYSSEFRAISNVRKLQTTGENMKKNNRTVCSLDDLLSKIEGRHENNRTSVHAYLRVSTLDQSHAIQERAIAAHLEKNALDAVWERDKASGKTSDRPAFQRVWAAVRSGHAKTVVVYDISRVGRNIHDALAFARDCVDRNVSLVSIKDGVDLTTPDGRLKLHILAAIAEYTREQISYRTKEGIAARKAKGLPHGGTAPGWMRRHTRQLCDTVWTLHEAGASNYRIRAVTRLNYRTIRKIIALQGEALPDRKTLNTTVYGTSEAKDR